MVILDAQYSCCREVVWNTFPSMARRLFVGEVVMPPLPDRYKATVVLREFKGGEECEAIYTTNLSCFEKARALYKYVVLWRNHSREIRIRVKKLSDSQVRIQAYDTGAGEPYLDEGPLKILNDLKLAISRESAKDASQEVTQ